MKTLLKEPSQDAPDMYDFVYELLKSNHFLTIGEIAKALGIRYDTTKEIIIEYKTRDKVFRLDWWTKTVFCVDSFEWPYLLMTKNFLLVRDKVIKKIQSNERIRNSYAVTEFLSQFGLKRIRKIPKKIFRRNLPKYPKGIKAGIEVRDQILLKYLHLWIIINKILLFENSRYHKNTEGFPSFLLDKRLGKLIQLFLQIQNFLEVNYVKSSLIDMVVSHDVKELDEWYEAYEYRYKELRFGQLPLGVIIWTAYNAFLQTRKDASEVSKIILKQVHNRLKPFFDENNKLDTEKLRKALIAESADDGLFANHGHLEWLQYVMQAREELEQTTRRLKQPKKSSIYRKTVKRAENVFPSITIDP